MAAADTHSPLMVVIVGPTASGKTRTAAILAHHIGGEIISADSRQVYRRMNLGTGKDYSDYVVNDYTVPVHLLDIAEPGYEYSVFEFQRDFLQAFRDIVNRNRIPVLCGGTGLYLEAALSGKIMTQVPVNPRRRKELEQLSQTELVNILKNLRPVHNTTDLIDRQRTIRAIEIAEYEQLYPEPAEQFPAMNPVIFGIQFERQIIRDNITERLRRRLDQGMIEEVRELLHGGLTPQQLDFYGLEYRFITRYLIGELSYEEMFRQLNTAIHQFAKRQMTWFRRMERKGFRIHWVDGRLDNTQRVATILEILSRIENSCK